MNRHTSLKDAKAIVDQVDRNKNGYIDKSEFDQVILPKLREDYLKAHKSIDDLRRLFKQADLDHSGFLTAVEL